MARDTYTVVHEDWEDQPSKATPILAEDMEHIEAGIKTAMDNRALKEKYTDNGIRLNVYSSSETSESVPSIEIGYDAKATGNFSAAIGYRTKAIEQGAASFGQETEALHRNAFVVGRGTRSSSDTYEQFICGKYNEDNSDAIVIVGGGFADGYRKNLHTLDKNGNAYFDGDIILGKYGSISVGEKISSSMSTDDVTEQCVVSAKNRILDITVPLCIVSKYMGFRYMYGGEYIGEVSPNGFPNVMFSMSVYAMVAGGNIAGGRAVLTNLISQSIPNYGYKFEGNVEFLLSDKSEPKAKASFNLGHDFDVTSFAIFRTSGSAIDFTISELNAGDLTYDETMAILNSEGEVD